jgi:hypothetical protein
MEAPSHGSTPDIALRPFKAGARSFQGADLVNVARLREKEGWDDHLERKMRHQGYLGPLTRDNYQRAIARRPAGTIGRGFEPAYLKDLGIIDTAPVAEERTHTPEAQAMDVIIYRDHRITPVKVGPFTQFEVANADGELLRPQRFRKLDTAEAFVDSVVDAPKE